MARKTKKAKIRAESRRERFLHTIKNLKPRETIVLEDQGGQIALEEKLPSRVTTTVNQHSTGNETFAYLKTDLVKTFILAAALIGAQVLIYLTLF